MGLLSPRPAWAKNQAQQRLPSSCTAVSPVAGDAQHGFTLALELCFLLRCGEESPGHRQRLSTPTAPSLPAAVGDGLEGRDLLLSGHVCRAV